LLLVLSVVLFSSCKTDFGNRYSVGNLDIYYTKEISKDNVKAIGDYFHKNDLILETKHAIQITSDNTSFILRMILDSKYQFLPEKEQYYLDQLEIDIGKTVFDGLNFRIEICDGNFNPIQSFR